MFRFRTTVVLTVLLTPLLFLWGGAGFVSAQNAPSTTPRMMEPEYPTITGTHNNLSNPTFGAAHTNLRRLVPSAYENGFSEPRGGGISLPATLPNTRDVSNIVATQSESMTNTRGVSDLFWQMFQLLDHDLDLTEAFSPAEPFDIAVNPATDPPLMRDIALSRSIYDTATGTTNPRQQINEITAWIDASNVYGSDLARANWKRADLPSGIKSAYLLTSTGNLLPIETGTVNGQTVDLFAAGDVRASEQSGLTAVHTLWMREHNRLVTRLRAANPSYTEEQLYQRARALVSAEMQMIVYNEMLPLLLGPTAIPAYSGYDDTVDPNISNAFSTAAFRFGHTMLSPQLRRLDPTGSSIPAGDLPLRDAFFNIQWIRDEGIDSILRGLMTQSAQELDAFIIDDVRSFLFAPEPGSPGSDLAALNMQRGREHGLPSYNGTRAALGLTPAATFADITSDTDLQAKLSTAYGGDIEAVDLWMAGLAEDNVAGAMVGETFHAILLDQFVRLRDGDRFWHANRDWTAYGFANDPLLDDSTSLSAVRLADIVAWNTNITLANDDVLLAGNVDFFSCDDVSEIPQIECEALVALYAQTNGDNWTTRTNWLETTTPCSWYGVTCSGGRIVRLELMNNNLSGAIPPELGQLTSLQTLDLNSNLLNGGIPLALGSLSSVQILYLYNNLLTGDIPPELGNLSSIQDLRLATNQLTGSIPVQLGNLLSLEHLYLRNNQLSGVIPIELGNLLSLQRLLIENNQLTGAIPSELSNLSALQLLYLSNNQLSGSIPPELSNLTSLTQLYLDGNQLTGSIPVQLSNLLSLEHLYLRNNQLSGVIPIELGNLLSLQRLLIENNQLTGTIPLELSSLPVLQLLYLSGNQLSGQVPAELGNLSSLESLFLHDNQLSGALPNALVNLQLNRFYITDTQLCVPTTGTFQAWLSQITDFRSSGIACDGSTLFDCGTVAEIPAVECEALIALYAQTGGGNWTTRTDWLETTSPCSWHGVTCSGGSSGRVSKLELNSNQLSGSIPSELGNLASLTFLRLSHNQLSGSIPSELGNLSALTGLYLHVNQLSGTIPSELGDLSLLHHLYLQDNQLSGTIPSELGNLSVATFLELNRNQLSGPIPVELGNLSTLKLLSLNDNQLSGPIPAELGNLSSLLILNVAVNQLSGRVPAELGNLSSLENLFLHDNQLSGALPNALVNLQLNRFYITDTQLCVPTTDTFQAWLSQITDFRSSGIACEDTPNTVQGIYVLAFDAEPTSAGNLSPYAQPTLNRLREATLLNPATRAIVLVDTDGPADTLIFVIENGEVELIDGLPDANGVLDTRLREFNTADGEQIGRFLKWARDTYSAEKEIVTIIGHGNALTPEADYATLFAGQDGRRMSDDPLTILPTYLDIDPTVTDAHTNDPSKPFDLLSTYDVRTALDIATDGGANPIDVLDLVHCFAATVEELFETSNPGGTPFAEMIVASPLYAYFSSMMPGEALAAADPNADAQTLATTLMTTYQSIIDLADSLDSDASSVNHPGIITVVNTNYLDNLKNAIDSLSANLISEFEFDPSGTRQKLRDAYLNAGIYYDSNFCAPQTFELAAPDAVVDIGTLMSALVAEFANSEFNVDLAALAVKSIVSVSPSRSAVVAHSVRSGTPWFAGDLNPVWMFEHPELAGLGIYADLGGTVKEGRTIISWQYPFYIDESAETGFQFVKNGPHPSWSDVLAIYWEGTPLDTMACLPELVPTRSMGEITVVDVLLAQGALRVGQPTEVGILVRADTVIENSLLEVVITLDKTNTVVYSDTISTGYLLTGTHEIVMGLPFMPTVVGNYTITPTIDVDNRVAETNEDDNQLSDSAKQRLIVHDNSGLTIDVQTVDGREWFASREIDLVVTSELDGQPEPLSYILCDIFELTTGAHPTVRVFERTHTRTDSDLTGSSYTLTLPDSVAAGRIEVQCRGAAMGVFTGRPAKVAFNFAPASRTLVGGRDHYIFTGDMSMATLAIDVSAESGTITTTVWQPFNIFTPQEFTLAAGQNGQFIFSEAFAGEYVIVIEGTGDYTVSGQRNSSPGRRATAFVSPVFVQRLRPTFVSAPANVETPRILEIMNVADGAMLKGAVKVEINALNMPTMDVVALYLNDKHIADGVPMLGANGMYAVEFDASALPAGKQMLMVKVMANSEARDAGEALAHTDVSICIEHCGVPSAVTLRDTSVGYQTAPLLLLTSLLLITIVVVRRRPKRVV